MKTTLETLLEREIRAALDGAIVDDANADFWAGKIIALRWALAKVRRRERQQGDRKSRRFAPFR